MAKRELSNVLKNLKFMQRGANKEDKTKKEEEVIPDGNFRTSITTKKCMVIMEGDPIPGAVKGRMSFQSFNPSIDKLNNPGQSDDDDNDATCSADKRGKPSSRENEEPVSLNNNNKTNGDLKRKQVEDTTEAQFPNKSPNVIENNQSSSSNNRRKKSQKRGKLDFNVLRSPKSQHRTG